MNMDRGVILRVCSQSARWTVTESGRDKAVADFGDKDDAVEYAHSLATAAQEAVIEIYGEDGRLESRTQHAASEPLRDSSKDIDTGTATTGR